MNDCELIDNWADHCRAGGAPATTMRVRLHYLERLAADEPALLCATPATLARWMGRHDWSANTRKTVRSALRSFYAWAVEAGELAVSPAAKLPPVKVPRARANPAPEAVYKRALAAADERVELMLRLAGQMGLRRAEVARCRREDLARDLVGWSLRVRGKGGHVRVLPVVDADLVRRIRACPPGWLFPSGQRPGEPLTAGHVGKLLGQALAVGYSGHSLRHRCGTVAYAATRDLLAVQQLLGHARPETTAGYVVVPDDALRCAVSATAA